MPAFPSRYPRLNDFAAPARARAEIWRTVAGLVIALAFYVVVVGLVLHAVGLILGPVRGKLALAEVVRGASPASVVEIMFSFLALAGGVALALALLMNRSLVSLIGPPRRALGAFLRLTPVLIVLTLGMMALTVMSPEVSANLPFRRQLPWLPLALVGLMVQTGSEELLFRGYLQQQLAARFSRPWVWMGVPALAFGALHYAPAPDGPQTWLVVGSAVAFGLAAADLTARTGNLGAAVALHFANNVTPFLLIGSAGHLDGLALFTALGGLSGAAEQLWYVAIEGLWLLVMWLTARLVLRV